MQITVTQEDISQGVRCSCNTCPVARAASRAFGGNVLVRTTDLLAFSRWYQLPTEATQFIADFDTNKPVQPFSFEVK
jgi:hypothetical protein